MNQKKSKKFIKFKDFIIKLPNSTGLSNSRNPATTQPNQAPVSDVEGAGFNPPYSGQGAPTDYSVSPRRNPGGVIDRLEKGYSIYVVDDEHEIHRFDMDTYEWSIVTTTKDVSE